jgi:hypothetical protein
MHTPAHSPRISWRSVALPAEHGGWGLLGEPIALGLALAPSVAGVCLAVAAVAAFLARHPLRLVMIDRRKRLRYPRTAVAERFLLGYSGITLAFLVAGLSLSGSAVWPVLGVAAPVGLLALVHDALGRSREVVAETAGAVALCASASAVALAGGFPVGLAWGAGLLLALRAIASVLYVRARIRLDRGIPAAPWLALAAHALALVATLVLARLAWAPWVAAAAFAVLLLRAAWCLSPRRGAVRPQTLGYQELAFGLLTLAVLALGYRAMA